MTDRSIFDHINPLANEEGQLWGRASSPAAG